MRDGHRGLDAGSHGHHEGESGAPERPCTALDVAAVRAGDVADDRETEPTAAPITVSGLVESGEPLEDALALLARGGV